MTSVRVRPGSVYGVVRAPSSKSYTHRALVLGHLAGRRFRVRCPLDSDDTRATALAVTRLGTPVTRVSRTSWRIDPAGDRPRRTPVRIDCHESGTTLRFSCALAALGGVRVVLTGSDRLSERPIEELLSPLRELGAQCRHLGNRGLPVEIQGPVHAGHVLLNASKSSQFASALLLALPSVAGSSSLRLTGRIVSRPYLDATLAAESRLGVRVRSRGREFLVTGPQRPHGEVFVVPGDASSAAYLWAAAAVSGGSVRVRGVASDLPQADLAILDLLRATGADVARTADGWTVRAGNRRPIRVDLTDAPDLVPLAGVLAATARGTSRISGVAHVALKESDRRAGTAALARRFGARVETATEALVVHGTDRVRPVDLPHLTDHRMVMSAAVGALAAPSASRIGERDAVAKSFPGFWDALDAISGGAVER